MDFVSILESIENVDNSILKSDKTWKIILKDQNRFWKSPGDIFMSFKRPADEAIEISRSAEILNHFIEIAKRHTLTNEQTPDNHHRTKRHINLTDNFPDSILPSLLKFSGCAFNHKPINCGEITDNNCQEYRTITGQCNNLEKQFWGASNQPLRRYVPAVYEDGLTEPLGWNEGVEYNGFELPKVRMVSNLVANLTNDQIQMDASLSHLSVTYGQYIDHDYDFSPLTPGNVQFFDGQNCKSSCEKKQPCYPIDLPETETEDPKTGQRQCLPFFRSAATCGTDDMSHDLSGMLERQQLNVITSYLDASTVYGSNMNVQNKLRAFDGLGRLKVETRFNDNGMHYMPGNPKQPCVQSEERKVSGRSVNCFLTGDHRASEHLTLSGIHTMWLREHNKIVIELAMLNPHWSEETLYQQGKKLMEAFHQKVAFSEYFTSILGEPLPTYTTYNSSINPTIANVFSTAAFRFGHATVSPFVNRLDENWEQHPEFPSFLLHKAFFSPWRIVDEGGFDPLIRGLLANPAKKGSFDNMMVDEMREKLFALQNGIGFDLASINLQRGRDHGLPLYAAWREFCGFSEVESFDDLAEIIPDAVLRARLEDLYGHPGNMDIWLAGLLEKHVGEARVGPTFSCIIKKQFLDVRDGDRFWYQNEGVFSMEQVAQIEIYTIARLVCDTTGIGEVQREALKLGERVPCQNIPDWSLEPWREQLPEACASTGLDMFIDSDLVSWKLCDKNPIRVNFDCKKYGFEMTGSTFAICDAETGNFKFDTRVGPRCLNIDECAVHADICDSSQEVSSEDDVSPDAQLTCIDTPGSFKCVSVPNGPRTSNNLLMNDIRDAFHYQGKALVANAIVFGGVLVLLVIILLNKIYKATRQNSKITTERLTRKLSKMEFGSTRHEHSVL